MTVRTGSNRGDFNVDVGYANDFNTGVIISSVSQNGRNNVAQGDAAGIGTFYATPAVDVDSTASPDRFFLVLQNASSAAEEVNVNMAAAHFPYTLWLGGIGRNGTGSNGGTTDTFKGSAGINLGTQFTTAGSGVFGLNLKSIAATNTSQNGVLLVNHFKNEDNYALSKANADGTFSMYVKDNYSNGNSFEQDPIAFVYVPSSAVGTKRLVAMGRVNSNGTTDVSGGTYTITKGGTGQWYLSIPSQSNTTGVLIISPENGGTLSQDNIVSYQWDGTNSRWVIESRDINGTGLPTLEDGGTTSPTEDMFSFAFFRAPIAPTVSLTSPSAGATATAPAAITLEATAADADGTVAKVEFLRNGAVIATDTTAPYAYTDSGLAAGPYNYQARVTDDDGAATTTAVTQVIVTLASPIPGNTALAFDGINDYVTMGKALELNVGGPPPINGFTLECWFRRDGTGLPTDSGSGGVTAAPLFGKGRGENDGSNVDCNIFFGVNSAGLLVADFESMATGLNHPVTGTNTPIANGTWYHAAVTFDGATGVWKLYLNGTQVGTATVSVAGSVPRYDSIQHFGIGTAMNSAGTPAGAFHGAIDEARVWSYVRTAAEIAASKDSELAAGTGLVARYGLNEGSGPTANSSTAVTAGTLTNGPVWVAGAPFANANTAPTISLTAPTSSYMPYDVALTASASDADGTVANVEFFVNGSKVGEDTIAPYAFSWTPPAVGSYSVFARAQDNLGARTSSAVATLEVTPNPDQAPTVTLTSPLDGATVSGNSATLQANVADPEGAATTVTFYGRQTTPATPGPDFTFVAIPDTQYYSEGAAARANTITVEQLIGTFGAQTQWVLDNKASRNIAFVSHMGDIVENGNFGGNPIQWERASAAMGKLENPIAALRAYGVPFGLAPGNHDIDPIGAYDTGSTAFYNQYFPVSRFAGRDYWGGNYGTDNTNNYQLFSASGLDFLVIHMAYDTTPNQPILDWADALMKAYPQRRVIVTSHWIIGQGNPAAFSTQGQAFYNNFKDNPNFFLMLCGHIHAEGRRSDTFEGRTVYSVLQDYQGLANGGQGLLRAFTFSPANNRIHVESWSPTQNRAANAADALPHLDGPFDLTYNMQAPVSNWVALGTVNVAAGNSSASLAWNGLEAGKNYEWYVAASDAVNVVSSPSRRFATAAGSAPTVSLDTPVTGDTFSSPATVSLTATASDSDGTVARVEFYHGGTKLSEATAAPYTFSWSGVQPGTYTLTAVAVDNTGLTTFSSPATITVNLGDHPPVVAITAPAAGTSIVSPGSLTLSADATDNEGAVTKVAFYEGITNPVLLGEDTSAPFSLSVANLNAGTRVLTARATDSVGQTTTSASVTITVVVEAAAATPATFSAGNFDVPSWTVAQTTPAPRQFNLPG
ncbi:MAG: Ig-like domain-containing protein, partial [Roseimicrobium sp.]